MNNFDIEIKRTFYFVPESKKDILLEKLKVIMQSSSAVSYAIYPSGEKTLPDFEQTYSIFVRGHLGGDIKDRDIIFKALCDKIDELEEIEE